MKDSGDGDKPENWTYLLEKDEGAEESCGEQSFEGDRWFLRCCLVLGGMLIDSDLGRTLFNTLFSKLPLAMMVEEKRAKAIAIKSMRDKADDIARIGDEKRKRFHTTQPGS